MFRETVSGPDGSFIASGLVPGTYQVDAPSSQGFKKFDRKDLHPRSRQDLHASTSRWRSAAIEETVTVTAESPLVDVTSKEIGGNITSETLVQLPSVNGNFIGFVGLLPGIVPSISTESFGSDSISVNGQDPRNNNYMLDGGNNNDDVIGQRAGTQARTPIEAIQEFQVITGQYDAEFGRTSGAVVNAVTKAGTNQLPRQRLRLLPGRQPDDQGLLREGEGPGASPTRSTSAGAAPSAARSCKDKLHFFASLERFSIDRPNTINIPARPDSTARSHEGSRVEHDRPRRPPAQPQQHLQRPLAARDLAADEPDHRRGPTRRRGGARRVGRRPDAVGELQQGAVAHEGQHAAH